MGQSTVHADPNRKMWLSRFLASLVGSKWLVRFLCWLNVLVYRLSGGRLMNKVDGTPICLLTMTRRKSQKVKTIPLMYTTHADQVLLVASLGGADVNPAWYYNLKAHPQVEIQVRGYKRRMLAREATPQERVALWPVVVNNFPSYAEYQRKTTRILPIMICSS